MPDLVEVRRYGDGGPLVALLHGGPGAPGSMASLARELAGRFAVLEPLQRRSGDAPLTVARHVEDLAAVLPAGAALVGWSWGAMLALSFAAAHPERACSLALVGCGTYDVESRALYQEALAARLGEAGLRRVEELRRRMAGAAGSQGDRLLAALGRLMEEAQTYDPLPETGDPVRVDRQGNEETWGDVLRLQAEGVEPAAFAAVACPALMLHGDDDPHPGPVTFALLRRYVPQLQYRGFPRCGHRPWMERHAREPFLEALAEWLMAPGQGRGGPAP